MDDNDEIKKSTSRIAASIRVQLREQFPYIKTKALDAIVAKCDAEMMLGILVQ